MSEPNPAPADTGPISMTQAAGLLTATERAEPAPADHGLPEGRERPPRPDRLPAPDAKAASGEGDPPAASGDELTDADLGATVSEAEGEAAGSAPLDPPASFNAAEKAAFAQAPRAVQEALKRIEDGRRADLSKRQQEAHELRQKAESSFRAAEQERQAIAERLAPLVDSLSAQMQDEFADIKSPDDVQRLAINDPARYVQFDAKMKALSLAHQHRVDLAQRDQQRIAGQVKEHLTAERGRLAQAVPGWADEAAYKTGMGEVKSYLGTLGYDDTRIASIMDHRDVVIARKAMLYDRAVARRGEARTAATPSATVRPGAQVNGNARVERELAAASDRLSRTGSIEDALSLMRAPSRRT